ncbi:putative endo-1,3-beta-glucanase [Lineolata rhizophorae]|uniref:glucan endo-1,3-beta-D-glucosidase n=1 Tax=Lineolata rhizophorae TaxID=578093 RepID=A0A6A6P9G5_9PEZI|nr:putative endo-1,3-beta-glucanase [Lineolata rhizophorae]
MSDTIFQPITTDDIPSVVKNKGGHPVEKVGIVDDDKPIQTNKFYANLFLGSQAGCVFTQPYVLQWCKGSGSNAKSWGVAVAHSSEGDITFGEMIDGAARFYLRPLGVWSIILSAAELGEDTRLTTDSHGPFSVNCNLAPDEGKDNILTLPMVQGMGFVTGIYTDATILLQSGVLFREFSVVGNNGTTWKFRVTLENNIRWLIYVTPESLGTDDILLTMEGPTVIRGPKGFTGVVQVAKFAGDSAGDQVYDEAAGAYAVSGSVSADSEGNYELAWAKQGITTKSLLMFALPHHQTSFDGETLQARTDIVLQTTVKGKATAYLADTWGLSERIPTEIGFLPWSPSKRYSEDVSAEARDLMKQTGTDELSQDFGGQTDVGSMYFSGKGLAKFAMILIATHDIVQDLDLTKSGLDKLKKAFDIFVQNKQRNPLAYDTVWKGVVSTAGYDDVGADFGGTLYNDHHFHYGYFVYTAAVIGYLDKDWLSRENKNWVNTLLRDFANPIMDDPKFPFSRSFDWYHGHSWAKGLFESGDGKDQESTSEDVFAAYGLKMWGMVIGDSNMEARGNLMLGIQASVFQTYFLMTSDNTTQPPEFIDNKVTGILFENKVDHTTYFGANIEYIQGIHMIPLGPASPFIRTEKFVTEEWERYFDNGRADEVEGGWRGILECNHAIIDPRAAYKFFSQPNFDKSKLDGGASQTWYLAFAALLGGD